MEICLVLLLLFSMESGVHPVESVIMVTGYEGGSAEIRCPYDGGYEEYSKYLCKGECPAAWLSNSKDIPVQTQAGETNAQRGRFSLHDDTAARVFTVTITGLTAQDSGQYWCGVKTGFGKKDVYNEVMLSVLKSVSKDPTPAEPLPAEKGPSSPRLIVGTVAGIVLVLIAVAALLLVYFRKRQKDSQTLDHVTTRTGNLPVSTTENYSPASVNPKYCAPVYSNLPIITTKPQVDSKSQLPSDSASASASPESVYQTMTAAPVKKAKVAMTYSVKSVDNEYITMRPPLSTAARTLGEKQKDMNLK